MSDKTYPADIDCMWLATDQNGQLAAFLTAGFGPIPMDALTQVHSGSGRVERLIQDMVPTSEAPLLVTVPRPDDFIDLARRGFFVFDWTDIHRTTRQKVHGYEVVAVPNEPKKLGALPHELAVLVQPVKFAGITFSTSSRLDVREYFNSVEA
ncbi:hypothetical protein [Rhizobium rhizogenes]|uniref:hypothetical protein n=1 Tax=Rhizobium rhizogenes TaxID=359 RepID=UPI002271E5CC|nr:hypothetical protein [Rhizobium rhizogenes]